jgi:hypothetical protein
MPAHHRPPRRSAHVPRTPSPPSPPRWRSARTSWSSTSTHQDGHVVVIPTDRGPHDRRSRPGEGPTIAELGPSPPATRRAGSTHRGERVLRRPGAGLLGDARVDRAEARVGDGRRRGAASRRAPWPTSTKKAGMEEGRRLLSSRRALLRCHKMAPRSCAATSSGAGPGGLAGAPRVASRLVMPEAHAVRGCATAAARPGSRSPPGGGRLKSCALSASTSTVSPRTAGVLLDAIREESRSRRRAAYVSQRGERGEGQRPRGTENVPRVWA